MFFGTWKLILMFNVKGVVIHCIRKTCEKQAAATKKQKQLGRFVSFMI